MAKSYENMALKQKLKVPMGPFPTCKGPEGDKLQGTIVRHFFRIHFGTQYSKFKKIVRAVFA